MAYSCPRCGETVQKGSSKTAQIGAGLVGVLVHQAFASYECPQCGKIKRREFSAEDRNKMFMTSIGFVVGAVVLIIAVVAALAALNS